MSASMLLLLMLCINLTIASSESGSADSSSDDCNSNEWEVKYIASTAKFSVYNPCNSRQQFELQISSLIEYDTTNTETTNTIPSFDSINGNWDNTDIGDENEYEGNNVLSNVFRADDMMNQDVNFTLETIFFTQDAIIYNKSTAIDKYSLKWNVGITNWPFLNVNNTLKLCINITTNEANKGMTDSSSSDDGNDNDSSDDMPYNEWNIGNFGLQTLNYANCDGSDKISVHIEDVKTDNLNKRVICFNFDYCESGIIKYDPIVSYHEIANNVQSQLSLGAKAAIGVSVVVMVFIIGAVLYCIYRKTKHTPTHPGLLHTASSLRKECASYDEGVPTAPPQQNL